MTAWVDGGALVFLLVLVLMVWQVSGVVNLVFFCLPVMM